MDIAILITLCISILIQISLFVYLIARKGNTGEKTDTDEMKKACNSAIVDFGKVVSDNIEATNKILIENLNDKINSLKTETEKIGKDSQNNYEKLFEKLSSFFTQISKANEEQNDKSNKNLKENFNDFTKNVKEKLTEINDTVNKNLSDLRTENLAKLTEIQKAVDDKLQKALDERLKQSFENVITQIGNVNKTVGEIKGLASDVGSLKKVLTNVKTKGIMGEVILGNIISETLTKEQYEENIPTKKGSRDPVEFAIKIPGKDGDFIYLPVDSKFPLETYHSLTDALELGDKDKIDSARKELRSKLKTFAKDIKTKYVDVPNTTDFALMFLPTEGLYVEAINSGLFDEIQKEYKINIVGPTTITALLNALQMGFKSLVIQKKSQEVFNLLSKVRNEFDKFSEALISTQKRMNTLSDDLENLVGTRTRKLMKELNNIDTQLIGDGENTEK